MAKGNKVGVHGTDAETGRDKAKAADGKAATGTKCPVTREQFNAAAKAVVAEFRVGNQSVGMLSGVPRSFDSGSVGWYITGKIVVDIDGVATPVQIGLNATVVGSKELPAAATSTESK